MCMNNVKSTLFVYYFCRFCNHIKIKLHNPIYEIIWMYHVIVYSIYFYTFVIFVFWYISVCSVLFAMGSDLKKSALQMLKDAFINLICLSAIIGVFCFVNSISLPQPIFDVLQYSANTTVCLSMIYIGSLLAAANVREIFKDKKVYIFSFLTLIVMPIITKLICGTFMSGMALSVLVVLMGTPAAAALPSFADLYGNDEKRASEYAFVSTILSVITLPLVAQFLCQ